MLSYFSRLQINLNPSHPNIYRSYEQGADVTWVHIIIIDRLFFVFRSGPVPFSSTKSLHLPRSWGLFRLWSWDIELLWQWQRGVRLQCGRRGRWQRAGRCWSSRSRWRTTPQRHITTQFSQRGNIKCAEHFFWKDSEHHTPLSVKTTKH